MVKDLVIKMALRLLKHDDIQRELLQQRTDLPLHMPSAETVGYQANASAVYDDLNNAEQVVNEQPSKAPIFISARFRSGSTFLWNLFRNIEGIHSYYEPLNERKWFDETTRGGGTDNTHKGVSNYWSEYESFNGEQVDFTSDWTFQRLWLDETSSEPALKHYIEQLIAQAPERPVLQFNRVDFRLPWLKANFPSAKIVHLYRHPRDQWISVMRNSAPISLADSGHRLSQYNIFYTMEWAKNLSVRFPFLDVNQGKHPYYYHYLLWRLSYMVGAKHSDISISFESLCQQFERVVPELCQYLAIESYSLTSLSSLASKQSFGKWQKYADNTWFSAVEQECELVLKSFFQS